MRVLILMSDTGGGHRAAAEAIQEGFQYLYGDAVAVTIVDAWKNHVAWPINRLACTYSWIVNEAVWLWKSFWLLARKPGLVNFLLKLLYPLVAPGLLNLFKTCRPDLIISVHPLLTLYPLTVLKRAKLNTPFITVVTDLVNGYPTWYQPQTTLCLVSTEAAQAQALGLGLPPEKIEVCGHPVALKFATGIEKKSCLRRKLGLVPDRPVVLLAGGAEGYGHIVEIACCIAGRVSSAQLIIVAGRNDSLRKKLETINWEIPTTVFGFVPNMPELMAAADIFITKAGPNSICEAFIAKLPVVLFGCIPGQEEGNVHYVLSHNAGVYEPNPAMIADLLVDWLQPDNVVLSQMACQGSTLAHPEAALAIARRAYELVPHIDEEIVF